MKGHVEGDGVIGSERVGESDLGYGVVLRVAVVGSDEVHGGGEVAVAVGVDVGDGDAAEFFGGVVVADRCVADSAVEAGLAGEGGLGAEGVEVEVEGDRGEGLAGEVFVGEGFGGIERFPVGVEMGVDRVGDDAGGERLAVGGVGGDAGLSLQGQRCERDGGGGEEGSQHSRDCRCFGLGWGDGDGVKLKAVATATPTEPLLKAISPHRTPLSLWHLLSLDAPTVAALWTWFIASANHIYLPVSSTLSMALAVWMLYAGDRLMDARVLDVDPARYEGLEARHYFHHRHRAAFLAGILLCCFALAALLPRLDAAAIRLYLMLGGPVAGYFIVIHAIGGRAAQWKVAHRMPKEIAVGLCFAAATFIPTVARRPDLRLSLLSIALLFAALCSLNCLFIYAWEHEDHRTSRGIHAMTRAALGNLRRLSAAVIFCGIALVLLDHRVPWPVSCAGALSAAILLLLHDRRRGIARTTLRAAADLALTTPLLFFPFVLR